MKTIISNSWHAVLRFDEAEDVVGGVLDFVKEENIQGAWLSAIGSTKELEIAFYDSEQKEYMTKNFAETMELAVASGTLAILDGQPVIHWHGVLSRSDYSVIGGHISKMIANMTIEVFIHKLNESLSRTHDPKTGLNILK